jgi:uncharacterized membrane protein
MANTRKITLAAVSAAIIFAVTWIIRIPVPGTSGGYVNLGDTVIYAASFLLGGPAAAAAAAVGSALADLAAGSVVYAPATFVIKGTMALAASALCRREKTGFYLLACLTGGAVMTAGYALYESVVFGAAYALLSLPYNLIQWGGSVIAAMIILPALKQISRSIG